MSLIAILIFCSSVFSQNTVETKENKDLIEEIGPQTNVFGFQMYNAAQNTPISGINTVYIEQIGVHNLVDIKLNTNRSNAEIVQKGAENTVRMNVVALEVLDRVEQSGSNHFFSEYANTPSLLMQREINQNGYNQSLTIHGNNSISEKIRLNMSGSLNSVIIRNFN